MREVIMTSIFSGFGQKNYFSEGWYWFKFDNLEPALSITWKIYTSVEKGLKLKFRKFWGSIPKILKATAK